MTTYTYKNLIGLVTVALVMTNEASAVPVFERATEREKMVKMQIEQRGVKNEAVLKALAAVPRHKFVSEDLQQVAYSDSPLPIGYKQTISQPYIVGFMSDAAQIKPTDKVLEIGTGSGYQAAVLSQLAKQVYTIEIVEPLGRSAEKLLKELGYKNVSVKVGDGYKGWGSAAPFDVIFVTAAPDHIPQPLIDQLKMGGRFIIPVGEGRQHLVRVKKTLNGLQEESLLPVSFVPMTGIATEKQIKASHQ